MLYPPYKRTLYNTAANKLYSAIPILCSIHLERIGQLLNLKVIGHKTLYVFSRGFMMF